MKFLLMSAVALAFAAPAMAQTAPPSGHAQQAQPMGAQATDHAGHGQHQGHGQGATDHSEHANCCGDATGNGRMDCCEGAQAAQRPCCDKHAANSDQQPNRPSQSK